MSAQHNYGVEYKHNKDPSKEGVLSLKDLTSQEIKYVRLQWLDVCNVMRGRIIPTPYFIKVAQSSRPAIAMPRAVLSLIGQNTLAPGTSASVEWLAIIDMSTLRAIPYSPGHASVFATFESKVPHPKTGALKLELCPRTALAKVVETAKKELGISFLVGFETEFMFLKSKSPIESLDVPSGWSSVRALTSNSMVEMVLQEIGDAIQQAGIEVQMIHSEGGRGQFEIVSGPLPPLQAADAVAIIRQTIHTVALKYDVHTTMAPRVFPDQPGSSSHVHISIQHRSPVPSTESPKLHAHEASFLAGVLNQLRAIVAVTLPIPASYERVKDGVFSGGTYVCWGDDARETHMRLCNAGNPKSRNFEFRALDQTANPYLALAALIGSGVDGVRTQAPLTVKDAGPLAAETELSVAQFTDQQRRDLNVTSRLPLTWEEAMECISENQVVKDVLGEEGFEQWLNITKTNAKHLQGPENFTDKDRMELLVQTY